MHLLVSRSRPHPPFTGFCGVMWKRQYARQGIRDVSLPANVRPRYTVRHFERLGRCSLRTGAKKSTIPEEGCHSPILHDFFCKILFAYIAPMLTASPVDPTAVLCMTWCVEARTPLFAQRVPPSACWSGLSINLHVDTWMDTQKSLHSLCCHSQLTPISGATAVVLLSSTLPLHM